MHERDASGTEANEHNGTPQPGPQSAPSIANLRPGQLDLDDINIENAYFRSFDAIVRRQLDPVWHKVGPRTKQLVGDLATLRNLLG